MWPYANERLNLTGAAILVFRASTSLQAARQLSARVRPQKGAQMETPHDHFRRVVADTGDCIAAIRAIREQLGLNLRQAKEVMLQAEGNARSLVEHEERIAAALERLVPVAEISYDLVMGDDMDFVRAPTGCPARIGRYSSPRGTMCLEPEVVPQRWEGGALGVLVRFPRSARVDRAAVEQVLSAALGVWEWLAVRGPDSMQLRVARQGRSTRRRLHYRLTLLAASHALIRRPDPLDRAGTRMGTRSSQPSSVVSNLLWSHRPRQPISRTCSGVAYGCAKLISACPRVWMGREPRTIPAQNTRVVSWRLAFCPQATSSAVLRRRISKGPETSHQGPGENCPYDGGGCIDGA